MTMTPGPAEPDPGAPLSTPPGQPEGSFLALPQPKIEGEMIPPIPVQFHVGLTKPDVHGRLWALLIFDDGTVRAQARIPWQVAAESGAAIANGLAQMQARAEQMAGPQIVTPPAAGGLIMPGQFGPLPGLNGAGR
jgi:hypothetical protein